MLTVQKTRHNRKTVGGVDIAYRESGSREKPALVLLHGFPSSSHMFRNVIPLLSDAAHMVAPDMPAFGFSAVPSAKEYEYTFENISRTTEGLLDELGVGRCYLYVQDWGVAVGYHLATRSPDRILGLIVQNGSAHEEGLGSGWDSAKAYWAEPSAENRAKLPDWLNFEGTRHEYVGGLPDRLTPLVPPECWHLDWGRSSRPNVTDIHFELFRDFRNHVARFPEIRAYHRRYQPPCLILWGRHDPYFELQEVMAYNRVLETVETHVFDGGHFLLETHAPECAALMREFIADRETRRREAP
ncbi:alpha/beta hydrolase [Chelativorans sp.]|uniref:alpha/beta fold hydrolase n=1 Tax=Chelativorans sp. TaxID=2203393 RepID=UPI002811A31F|nr:alpha/beta hydrolase [Chelativorans sp.]